MTKFICTHCHKTYTGSYTCVRKHLCGIMQWDEGKTLGVKTYPNVSAKDINKYQKKGEASQHKSKNSRVEYESSQIMFSC
jgi:hypothetical protein